MGDLTHETQVIEDNAVLSALVLAGPLASETLGFGNLGGVHQACSSVATVDSVLSVPTGHS